MIVLSSSKAAAPTCRSWMQPASPPSPPPPRAPAKSRPAGRGGRRTGHAAARMTMRRVERHITSSYTTEWPIRSATIFCWLWFGSSTILPTALPFLPSSHHAKQNWADSGTTKVKSTKPSLGPPWSPCTWLLKYWVHSIFHILDITTIIVKCITSSFAEHQKILHLPISLNENCPEEMMWSERMEWSVFVSGLPSFLPSYLSHSPWKAFMWAKWSDEYSWNTPPPSPDWLPDLKPPKSFYLFVTLSYSKQDENPSIEPAAVPTS